MHPNAKIVMASPVERRTITCFVGPEGSLLDVIVGGNFTPHLRGSDDGKSIVPDDDEDDEKMIFSDPVASCIMVPTEQDEDAVWTKDSRDQQGRERNRTATVKLIELYRKYKDVLIDKNVLKKNVWDEIAREMQKCGFNVTGMKCHQKWRNLERDYRSWVYWLSDAGGRMRKSPPECLDDLHELFQNKRFQNFSEESINGDDARNTKLLTEENKFIINGTDPEHIEVISVDSLATENGESGSESSHQSCPFRKQVNKVFGGTQYNIWESEVEPHQPHVNGNKKRLKRILPRPASDLDYVLEAIKKMREEEAMESNRRFENLQKMIERQHRERMECMFELIEAVSGKKSKLKERFESASSSEG